MFISVSSSSPEWHNRCVGCAILSCLNREFMVFGFVCAYLNLIMNLYELLAIFELEFVHGIICKLWIRFATTSERFFDYTCVAVLVQPASIFFSSLISLFASLIPHKMLWNFAAHSIGGKFYRQVFWIFDCEKSNWNVHTGVGANWAISRSSLPCAIHMQIIQIVNVYSTQLTAVAATTFFFTMIRQRSDSVLNAQSSEMEW